MGFGLGFRLGVRRHGLRLLLIGLAHMHGGGDEQREGRNAEHHLGLGIGLGFGFGFGFRV